MSTIASNRSPLGPEAERDAPSPWLVGLVFAGATTFVAAAIWFSPDIVALVATLTG